MRQLALFLAAGAAVAAVFLAVPARADQTDPRLDALFEALRDTQDEARAAALTAEIWARWLDSGNNAVNERLRVGSSAMDGGNWPVAVAAFDEVVTMAPDFAEGWNKRATLRYFMGQHEASIADCARVLALEPRHFGALSGLGMIHVVLGEYSKAINWFERALAVNPHMPAVRENVSMLRERLRGKPI
jgi:tetratricopeptide (TPR) repeat protein